MRVQRQIHTREVSCALKKGKTYFRSRMMEAAPKRSRSYKARPGQLETATLTTLTKPWTTRHRAADCFASTHLRLIPQPFRHEKHIRVVIRTRLHAPNSHTSNKRSLYAADEPYSFSYFERASFFSACSTLPVVGLVPSSLLKSKICGSGL